MVNSVLFRAESLGKSFGKKEILHHIDLTIQKNEVVSIIGPSGAGKSTLLRCINLLERPTSGTIHFGNIQFDAAKPDKKDILYMRQNTGMVFQQFNLFREKTALENISFGLIKVQKKSTDEAESIARTLLTKVGLAGKEDYYPVQLSGGQQQRVAIARAVALNPQIILFDEPTSALDPEMIQKVLDVIQNLAHEGQTMLIVSHEMNFVRHISDRVIFMADGTIEEAGTAEDIFERPKKERTRQFLNSVLGERI